MDWGPIGVEVYERTYQRTKPDGTKETWPETVRRTVEGNAALSPVPVPESEVERLIELITDFKAMPAGRHLWVSGVPGRQFLFNCHRAGFTERIADHVGFAFDELMKGGGVGANYSWEYTDRQHPITQAPDVVIVCETDHPNGDEVNPDVWTNDHVAVSGQVEPSPNWITVDDSRKGWVHAVQAVCDIAQSDHPTRRLYIDVSNVRPRGEPIRGFGGVACGPGPLAAMIRAVVKVLSAAEGRRLSGLEMMEIDHQISACVISGNVRRSARMSIMHWRDNDILAFIRCKGDDHSQHWTTNISVEIDDEFIRLLNEDDPHVNTLFDLVTAGMMANGEPGFFNSSLASKGEYRDVRCTNPCGEIALEEWENCNLGHINLANCDPDERYTVARLMTRFLIRATFGNIESPLQAEVVARNRRIGVGFYGFQEWLGNELGLRWTTASVNPRVAWELQQLYATVKQTAHDYAHQLRIPVPIKLTTVAPTGTIAKLSGHTEGLHTVYSRYGIRRVRYAENDPALASVPAAELERDVVSTGTVIRKFCYRDIALDRMPEELVQQADEIPPLEMFEVQAMVQESWADNAVSFTANLPADCTLNELRSALRFTLHRLKGTTVFPDREFVQAPYERTTKEVWQRMNGVTSQSDAECATGACPVR